MSSRRHSYHLEVSYKIVVRQILHFNRIFYSRPCSYWGFSCLGFLSFLLLTSQADALNLGPQVEKMCVRFILWLVTERCQYTEYISINFKCRSLVLICSVSGKAAVTFFRCSETCRAVVGNHRKPLELRDKDRDMKSRSVSTFSTSHLSHFDLIHPSFIHPHPFVWKWAIYIYIYICGYIWLYMAIYGYIWLYTVYTPNKISPFFSMVNHIDEVSINFRGCASVPVLLGEVGQSLLSDMDQWSTHA